MEADAAKDALIDALIELKQHKATIAKQQQRIDDLISVGEDVFREKNLLAEKLEYANETIARQLNVINCWKEREETAQKFIDSGMAAQSRIQEMDHTIRDVRKAAYQAHATLNNLRKNYEGLSRLIESVHGDEDKAMNERDESLFKEK